MELKDTIKLMESENYQDRYSAEYYQTKIRIEKLGIMLDKYAKGELTFTPSCSYDLLHEQYVHMKNYLKILKERADIEHVDLEY